MSNYINVTLPFDCGINFYDQGANSQWAQIAFKPYTFTIISCLTYRRICEGVPKMMGMEQSGRVRGRYIYGMRIKKFCKAPTAH